MDRWKLSLCYCSLTQPFLCVTQEARPQHLCILISWLSDYSQHHGRKCRQCEPAWGPCPGSVYGWLGCYSHNNYPPPPSRTETTESLRLMHSCGERGGKKMSLRCPKIKRCTAKGCFWFETQIHALCINMYICMCVCVSVLTGRSWQGGTIHRQVSSWGTWANHMQPVRRACSNTHPCTCSSQPERGGKHTRARTHRQLWENEWGWGLKTEG